jgi:type I restriction enzyme S subunit
MVNGELPSGWTLTTLGEATKPMQKRVNPQDYPVLPYIGMENVEAHTMRLLGTVPSQEMKSAADTFSPDDVLYGRLRPYLNKVYLPEFKGLCSTEFIVFRKVPHIHSRYLQYFLNSWDFVKFANSLNAGDRPRVKFEQLADHSFPLPPLSEQERIVAKIEELFTQLEAGTAALKRVQAGLKRYKASVLKAAVEGRLLNDESRMQNDGELPDGWRMVKLSEITSQVKDVDHKMPKPADSDIPYVSTKDFIGNEDIDFENAKHISEEDYIALTRKIKPELDDILLSRYGTIGEVRKVKTNRRFQASYSIAIIKPISELVFPDFLIAVLRSEVGQEQMRKHIRASSQPDLGLEYIRKFDIPLPPLAEQRRIVAEVERRLSVAQEVESVVAASVARAFRLRQSVLKSAFEGRLL